MRQLFQARRLCVKSIGKCSRSESRDNDPKTTPSHANKLRGPYSAGSFARGSGETLRQVTAPSRIVDHYPPSCSTCGLTVTPAMSIGHSARQVFDLPEPAPLVVTEHRAHDCRCSSCGAHTRASFPQGVNAPVQYGQRITAFVLYLLHYQLLPEDRLAELMRDLFGVKLVAATIARMSRSYAERLADFVEALRKLVTGAPVKHMDETGFRIGGKTQWLHIASTAALTFYRVCARRGSLLANVIGTVVHDHWKPYYTMPGVLHALCNAHHLRELKALIDIEKEDWARKMQRLLRRAARVTNRARDRGVALKPRLVERFERCYDAILAEGFAFHETQPPLALATTTAGRKHRGRIPRRTGHNLLLRLSTRKQDTLRFLNDPAVPFTNNQAERDGRMMKVKQKISGGFRYDASAADFAVIRSLISTAKKQGWDIIQALTQDPKCRLASLRTA